MDVDVYRNLVKGGLSIRARSGENKGRVVEYVDEAVVKDVKFVVQPAGRQRVLEEQQKNVHAFVRGRLVEEPEPKPEDTIHVTYDPYEYSNFVVSRSEQPIHEAEIAYVSEDGVDCVTEEF